MAGQNRMFPERWRKIADKVSSRFAIYIAVKRVIVYTERLNFGRRESLWFFIFSQGVNQA
jgi:hypothetical protein